MRVLHLAAGNLYGGTERFLSVLARRRDCVSSMEPEFALCFEGRIREELLGCGASVHMLGAVRARRPLSVLRSRGELRHLLSSRTFDIVVCHSAWTHAVFGPVIEAKLPTVFFMHDCPQGRHWTERWARRTRPDLVVCNSHFTKKNVVHMYPGVQTQVLYLPVDLAFPDESPFDRRALRSEFNTPPDSVVIVQVSRMEPWKGQTLHLEALRRIAEIDNWQCWMVGGPQRPSEYEYYNLLQETAYRYGIAERVRFLGFRSDVAQLLAASDIFCQPNVKPEPFGMVFIEALLTGLPVVATNMGGAGEIVEESCGLVIEPGDAQGLAEALKALIVRANCRQRLALGARKRALSLCDPQTQIPRLAELLERVVTSKSSDKKAKVQPTAMS
jgi:glycosyltransferase involved in cell wall biosynthesis